MSKEYFRREKNTDGMRDLRQVPLDQVETERPDRALAYSVAVSDGLSVGQAFYGKDNKWHVVLKYTIDYPHRRSKKVTRKPVIYKTFGGSLWTTMVRGGKYDNDITRDVCLS